MEEEYNEQGNTPGPGPGSEATLPDPVYDDLWKRENFWLDFFRKEGVKAGQSVIDTLKYGGAIKGPGIRPPTRPKLPSHEPINITPKPVNITPQKGTTLKTRLQNQIKGGRTFIDDPNLGTYIKPPVQTGYPSIKKRNPTGDYFNLVQSLTSQIDGTDNIQNMAYDDLPGPYADFDPKLKLSRNVPQQYIIDLQKQMYEDSIMDTGDYADITQKMLDTEGNAYESLRKEWVNKVWKPVFERYRQQTGTDLVNILATKPGFKYIEHKIAKGQHWYWRLKGKDPNELSNLRILFNNRYKTLKDSLEGLVYGYKRLDGKTTPGINHSIKNPNDKYIIDLELNVSPEMWIRMEDARPGNLVIKKAGSGEIVGAIGEYYQVLFSDKNILIEGLTKKGIIDPAMSSSQKIEAVRRWRSGILLDHMNIIKEKESLLQGLSETERLEKINQALFDDMASFKYEYQNQIPFLSEGIWKNIEMDMSKIKIRNIQQEIRDRGELAILESIRSGKSEAWKIEPPFKSYNKSLEQKTTKMKGTGRYTEEDSKTLLDDILGPDRKE